MARKEKDLYEGMTLFDDPKPTGAIKEQNSHIDEKNYTPIQLMCLEHLHAGEESVRAICEKLIEDGLIPDERFITGKPKFYPDICLFLNSLCEIGKASKISFTQDDCKFKLGNLQI
ncbi:DUF3895 domain-containing protein [Paenibacillus taichungensis]